jgi:tRNA pseudouridine38-40 synthase
VRNIKLVLEYDGTDFVGSQLQVSGRTVQGELETAVARLTGLPAGQRAKVALAGRTDTGVHAAGQVANFKTGSIHSLETFRKGLNAILPFDIAVLAVDEVDEEWHARFSAKEREYCYTIFSRSSRSALNRRFAHWVGDALDLSQMQKAANVLIGQHDFASFAGAGWGVQPQDDEVKPGTIRDMFRVECRRVDQEKIEIWLAANAFLPHMVRNIVGTLLQVGTGKTSLSDFEDILAAADRRKAGPTAPACGLCLVSVKY